MSQKIALCLSGGGFRAALFHLGVVRALRDAGWLSQIKYISSVSGGSILAAHLVLNWDRYSGTPEEFDEAAAELLRFVQKDIRGRIVRRYVPAAVLRGVITVFGKLFCPLLSKSATDAIERMKDRLTATGMLEYYYSVLYKGAHLSDLPVHESSRSQRSDTPPPELHILGTNITKATASSFSGQGFLSSQDSSQHHGKDIIKVSEAVAASSAFPGFFPPLHLSRSTILWDLSELATEHQYIADAGIVDNLGLSIFLQVQSEADLDFVIVSDATGSVDWAVAKRMRYVIGSTLRTLEILTGQSTQFKKEAVYQDFIAMKKDWTPVYLFIEISRILEKSRVTNRASLKNIRTDLDRFSGTEIFSLAQHGYGLARDALVNLGSLEEGSEGVGEEWPLTILGQRRRPAEREHRELMRSGDVHLGFRGFARDWLGWIFALLLIGGPLMGHFLIKRHIQQSVATQTRVERNYKVERFKAQSPIQVEPFEYKEHGAIDGPQYTSFEFLEDTRYFDLRKWKFAGDGEVRPYSPVTMVRETRVRKIRSEEYIRIQVMTTGTDVYLRSLREKDKFAMRDPKRRGGREMKVREIVLDLKDVDVGDEETLRLEATYYDAFQDPEQWWAGINVKEQISRAALVLIFPEDRPFESLECRRLDKEGQKTIPCKDLLEAKDKTYAYWEIEEPEIGFIYALSWLWPDPST